MLTLGKFNDIKLQCREQQQQQQQEQEQEQPRQQHHQQKAQQQQQQEQQQRKNNNMLPTLLSAFCVFIFAMSALQVTAAEEEGDSCSMKSIQGQCMAASKCYDRIDHYIREGLLKQDEIKSCGLGPREEIICCPLNVIVRTSKRPSEEACSKLKHDTPHTLTQHILGGTPVDSGEYPHMAAIAYPSTDGVNSYTFRCGGTLIDKRFVLTAAHCVVDDESQPQFVRLGVINLSQSLANDGIDVGIAKVHIHQNYSLSIKYNDVALLELAEEVKFTDFIRPTCLYTELNDPPSSNKYFVSGWGTINQRTRTVSNILLKAELNIVPLASCNISVAEASGGSHRQLMFGVQQTQLCAADSGGKRDACTGDSGGPLIMVNDATSKSYHAVGIVSVGFGCASRTPGLYTRVAAYLDFIESIVWPGQ